MDYLISSPGDFTWAWGKGLPRFLKKSGVFKTKNFGNFKTVDYIQIVVSNVVQKIINFFCENRYKPIKNCPICTKLTVSKLPEFAVLKKPKLFESGQFLGKKPREI